MKIYGKFYGTSSVRFKALLKVLKPLPPTGAVLLDPHAEDNWHNVLNEHVGFLLISTLTDFLCMGLGQQMLPGVVMLTCLDALQESRLCKTLTLAPPGRWASWHRSDWGWYKTATPATSKMVVEMDRQADVIN